MMEICANARLRIIGGHHDFEVWNAGLMDALVNGNYAKESCRPPASP